MRSQRNLYCTASAGQRHVTPRPRNAFSARLSPTIKRPPQAATPVVEPAQHRTGNWGLGPAIKHAGIQTTVRRVARALDAASAARNSSLRGALRVCRRPLGLSSSCTACLYWPQPRSVHGLRLRQVVCHCRALAHRRTDTASVLPGWRLPRRAARTTSAAPQDE